MQKELITQFGYKKIVDEFKDLLENKKPYWVKQKEIAAQFGDRSENAEYISAKEMIRNLDKRLRFLDKIINNSKVIDTTKIPHDRVNFGSEIKLLNLESNEEYKYILVGTFETNPKENKISNKSPLGRALFGKRINEEFEFQINGNFFEYEVVNIKMYEFK
ncbi:GreA/GreB family elongation factor [Halarcobacter anaerophilus]|jgi:transcription elongation factor GreA|uniref:Transcription elongation factor GreA n=1 Tax=Halarcobacter anaerophilus TaxID=877500 RepID=A0A4Q0Y350_9BACT|nr:transcription elongation factor GreA [Halarcobacter anaerophilus]QDF29287.1 transcription elongation factor GreB [Halarcobacter anaerophilus]RXJ64537.1 transcription elongation factor GreA [Halarcobacter anaerophilus]